jgi:hypothetical protein
MTYSNCFIHAVSRWVTRGGWLIMRRSHAGPYPHFIHADYLPEDLLVSQFVAVKSGRSMRPFFQGYIMDKLGAVKPLEVEGKIEWVLFGFWFTYFMGLAALTWLAYSLFTR